MFDIEVYTDLLNQQVRAQKLSKLTAKEYIASLHRINDRLTNGGSVAEAIDQLCNGSQQGSKYIAAVKKYERDVLDSPKSILYGQELISLRNRHKQAPIGREPVLSEETYLRKINGLRNEPLKLALRLQVKSGLRISEIGALRKEDIKLENEGIELYVRCGKGRKSRRVTAIKDRYLEEHLKLFLEGKTGGQMLFYSANYLKKKANELGIPTHDLRRINSRMRYREQRGNGACRRDARRVVQRELGHENAMTTNAYLGKEWSEEK